MWCFLQSGSGQLWTLDIWHLTLGYASVRKQRHYNTCSWILTDFAAKETPASSTSELIWATVSSGSFKSLSNGLLNCQGRPRQRFPVHCLLAVAPVLLLVLSCTAGSTLHSRALNLCSLLKYSPVLCAQRDALPLLLVSDVICIADKQISCLYRKLQIKLLCYVLPNYKSSLCLDHPSSV